MKVGTFFCAAALCALMLHPAPAAFTPLRSDLDLEQPQADILQSDESGVVIEIRVPGVERLEAMLEGKRWDRIEIPGGGYDLETGRPEVPHFTRLLVIPSGSAVHAEFEALESVILPDIQLMPAQGRDPADAGFQQDVVKYDPEIYARDEFYPVPRVTVGEPAVLRGARVVSIRMNPVQYNPVTRELKVTTRFRVAVRFEGTDPTNNPRRRFPLSASWVRSLNGMVLNTDDLDNDPDQPGSYLVICRNDASLISALQPLIEWKMRKGHSVTLETYSNYATTTSIKNIIQEAYDNWDVPPEFVLLVGDVGGYYNLPGWPTNDNYVIDHPYSQLDGNDILADVALGRLPAGSLTEVQTMVNKILYYEKMPYTVNTDWYHQGALLAGDSAAGISTVQTNRWIKNRMIQRQYTRIDTFWYFMPGTVAGALTPAINDGVLHVNYRGNNAMENFTNASIDALTNGRKMPFVVTITCNTGGFGGMSESLMEHFVVVGTPTTMKGAVAAVGTATLDTHTRQNNTVDMGIWAGIFDIGIPYAGEALNYGKLQLYNTYQQNDPQSVNNFSLWNMLAGDPGLLLFTHAIQYMTCEVPESVPLGVNALTLTVQETGVGPLADASVCLYEAGVNGMQAVGRTNDAGQVTLPITVTSTGNLKVTITRQNFYPIVDSLDIVQNAVTVGYYSHTLDDDNQGGSSGDGDGVINPGETVQIPTVFKNYGTATTATGISVTGTLSDPYLVLSDSLQTFPNLAPGATGSSSGSYLVSVAQNCPAGYAAVLHLNAVSNQGSWQSLIPLNVVSFDLAVLSAAASGGDTLLSPGETADLVLTVKNIGGKSAANLAATIASLTPFITVNDSSATFGTVNINGTAACGGNPFNLTAAANAPPGFSAPLRVTFQANGAVQQDTIAIQLGIRTQQDPAGPDGYGYYCFDNTDVGYEKCPTYSWVELDPAHGGSGGTQLNLSDPYENMDSSVVVALPFVFRYYGQGVNAITVCSNGWISCYADASFNDFRNYPIPAPMGPYAMIAPFWDDLITWSGGSVYTRYDSANHRFIVEWSRLMNLYSSTQQVFEVILYDPAHYITPTGDGEILFQYQSITQLAGPADDNPYSTVGIESWDQQTGIEVSYWNQYRTPGTAPLANQRAYLFTTDYLAAGSTPAVSITMTPVNPPIQIPVAGGSFNFNATLQNGEAGAQTFGVWIMVQLPNGAWYGPVLGPVNLTLPAGAQITRQRTQNIPGGAPAGQYYYEGRVGTYPESIWNASGFNFTKLGAADGGMNLSDWTNSGEDFVSDLGAGVTDDPLPTAFHFDSCHPNPFNPAATLTFTLPEAAKVTLEIYDLGGRLVQQVGFGESDLSAGMHTAIFDGSSLPSGIYFARLTAFPASTTGAAMTAVRKLVLLK
jgi:hypothetical protein